MIRHVVLLHLEPNTESRTLDGIVEQLRTLPDQIEAIERYQVGIDLGLAEANATIAVIGDFADDEAYLTYRDHPVHRRIIDELITPALADRAAIQFATD